MGKTRAGPQRETRASNAAGAGTLYKVSPLQPSLAMQLEGLVRWLRKALALAQSELLSPVRLPLRSALRAWRHGFTRQSYLTCGLDGHDPRPYVSEYTQNVRLPRVNGPFCELVSDKVMIHMIMEKYGMPCPRLYAVVRRGVFHAFNGGEPINDVVAWLRARLDADPRLVFKPIRGFKGKGFMVLAQNGTGWTLNGVAIPLPDALALAGELDDYLVTEFITQADYARRIYPAVANTVRLLTLWDVDRGEPFIAASAHRFGTQRSYPVDNWKGGLGGLSCPLDPASGELGPGVTIELPGRLKWFDRHPETGAPIAGIRVPGWPQLRERVLALARTLAFVPDIAWDVVMTDDGFRVLETNGPSGVMLYQAHRPLLADPRVRRCYEHYGVL